MKKIIYKLKTYNQPQEGILLENLKDIEVYQKYMEYLKVIKNEFTI